MDSPSVDDNAWLQTRDDWLELVPSALKFLSGETIGRLLGSSVPNMWNTVNFAYNKLLGTMKTSSLYPEFLIKV